MPPPEGGKQRRIKALTERQRPHFAVARDAITTTTTTAGVNSLVRTTEAEASEAAEKSIDYSKPDWQRWLEANGMASVAEGQACAWVRKIANFRTNILVGFHHHRNTRMRHWGTGKICCPVHATSASFASPFYHSSSSRQFFKGQERNLMAWSF